MALCKRWQFISPPIEVGEFLLILVKFSCFFSNFLVSVNFPDIFLPARSAWFPHPSIAVFPYKIRLCEVFLDPGRFAEKTFFQKIEIFSKKRLHFFQGHAIIYKSLVNSAKQTLKNIEAWLSLVERCVRDAEVASSNLVASIPACWSSGQDDALSRRKPGFDSRTGHEAVWNFHTASFFISIIVFINRKL